MIPPIFRFENCWFQRPDLKDIIKKVWEKNYRGSRLHRWQEKFRLLRKSLKGWDRNVRGKYKKNRKRIAFRLDELDRKGESLGINANDRAEQIHLQDQLRVMVREEEAKWLQRSKEIELMEGDNNTKFYHAKANGRRRKTSIVRLFQDEGVIEGQQNLKTYITDFYKNLFGQPNNNTILLDGDGCVRLSNEDSVFLIK